MAQAELTQVREQHKEPFYWLNEDSKEFLREGYLIEGVEPKERIRQIAENAEEILDEEGFADRFYDYMSRGFYSLAKPSLGELWTGQWPPYQLLRQLHGRQHGEYSLHPRRSG